MTIGDQVEFQWERVRRYFDRFRELNDQGRLHDRPSDTYVDDIYAFFINCYHLKDWIANDPSSPFREAVKDFGRDSPNFQICRDLCIGAKHLAVNDPSSSLPEKKLGRKHWDFTPGQGKSLIKLRIFVGTAPAEKDAFEIAENCMKEWEAFLSPGKQGTPS